MSRGFTLIELLVVVMLIGILVTLSIPTFGDSRRDQAVYGDAAAVAQIIRNARARAIGRGAAVIVVMSNASSSRGQYATYEAIANVTTSAGTQTQVVSSCKNGNYDFTNTQTTRLVEWLNLDGAIENQANIRSYVVNSANAFPSSNVAYICFTPTGRSYYADGAVANFDSTQPMAGALTIIVRRINPNSGATVTDAGLRRRVIVPPNGIARVVSGAKLATDPV